MVMQAQVMLSIIYFKQILYTIYNYILFSDQGYKDIIIIAVGIFISESMLYFKGKLQSLLCKLGCFILKLDVAVKGIYKLKYKQY